MVVRLKKLGPQGHREFNLTLKEAREAVDADPGKYLIVDEETERIIKSIHLRDGQKIVMVPVIEGG